MDLVAGGNSRGSDSGSGSYICHSDKHCHSERSEEPAQIAKLGSVQRSFAALRMTRCQHAPTSLPTPAQLP